MSKATILLIGKNTELCVWLKTHVLQPAGLAWDEAADLPAAHARLAVQKPHLIIMALSAQAADELAFVSKHETLVPTIVVLPERSLELIEAALAHGTSDILVQALDALIVTPSSTGISIARRLRM